MALFIQKPILWNTNSYQTPSGAKVSSGYPKKTGYGHEEWNNSPRLRLTRNNQHFRVFHTEGVKEAPLLENAGQTFIFLTASHGGSQQLVGIAGNAFGLSDDKFKSERLDIVEDLSLENLWVDAWEVENVKKCYKQDEKAFKKHWKKDLHWIPNWICPEEFFLWFDEPITLDARAITGKAKILTMFNSYTELNLATANRYLETVPSTQRDERWRRLADAIRCAPADPIDTRESTDDTSSATTVLSTVNARRGQGKFREDLMAMWGGACAVTGIACREVLKASHVKPWAKSSSKERLDAHNGLLLVANLDALFDAGLITFDSNGKMQISSLLDSTHHSVMLIPQNLRSKPSDSLSKYPTYHREHVYLE
ncbi:HNH endonuclease [Cupriavidus necator]